MTAFELLTFIHQKKLTNFYPNLLRDLKIATTLLVTVALAEHSLSKLNSSKTEFRHSSGSPQGIRHHEYCIKL